MLVVQSANTLLRWQFRLAHGLLGASLDALTTQAAACHAQAVLCEDLTVNGVLASRTPLALSTWHGRTGLSELPRLAAPIDWRMWAQHVTFDPTDYQSYAEAVYAATDAYLAREQPESQACLLSALLLTISMRRGQIACLQDASGRRQRTPRLHPVRRAV
jgi:hypothetical protein